MKRIALLLALVALPGCPWEVRPVTEGVCPNRPNCGQCSSEAVCVWDLETSRCQGVSEPRPGPVATMTEQCPPPAR